MKPDPVFVGGGVVFILWACYLAFTGFRSKQHHLWVAAGLWALFGAGLVVRGFAPNLEIRNRSFYIPPSLQTGASIPDLVARQKQMHSISGLLTLVAAIGLALYYFRSVFSSSPPQQALSATETGNS